MEYSAWPAKKSRNSLALNKTCQLDPAPITWWLVKDMRRLLSPFISLLFSKSLTTGCFPQEFKEAVVRLLLKKTGLDASELKMYRTCHFSPNYWRRSFRSVFRPSLTAMDWCLICSPHIDDSTAQTVTKVVNDLLLAADSGHMSGLCLLDLTAAFDTVDHELLISRLER